jgi:hypothetical protein
MSSSSSSSGVGLGGLLFVAFLVLKLCGVIHWSWWWVTAPLWGGLAIVLVIALIALAVYVIAAKK